MLTKSAALHCARKGYNMRCNSVHPAFVETPMLRSMIATARDPKKMKANCTNAAPLGQLAQPVRVALTGGTVSPGIYEVIAVLGKRRTVDRLNAAVSRIAPPA